jgi:ribosome-associated protein
MSASSAHQLVEIHSQPIELCKLLKIANLVSGGGEAKIVISEGYVLLNQQLEYQKRKKIYDGDIVEFNGEIIQVCCLSDAQQQATAKTNVNQTSTEPKPEKSTKKTKDAQRNAKNSPQIYTDQLQPSQAPTRKRKAISF